MNDRPTPETDAFFRTFVHGQAAPSHAEYYDRMRRLERERDEAREAAEKAKAFKRVMKEDNAKLRRDLDKAQRDADTFLENFGKTQERAINTERELDEARDDHRFLLREIFNLTQIGDPHPADLPMKALQAIAEMIDEHFKEARK